MKPLHYIILSLISSTVLISCIPQNNYFDDQLGNWAKRSDFNGNGRSEAVGFTIGNFASWEQDGMVTVNDLEIFGSTILQLVSGSRLPVYHKALKEALLLDFQLTEQAFAVQVMTDQNT